MNKLVYTCPNCGKEHKSRLVVLNDDSEFPIEELACEKSFYCECGIEFFTVSYDDMYIIL